MQQASEEAARVAAGKQAAKSGSSGSAVKDIMFGTSRRQGVIASAGKAAARSVASAATNQVLKSVGMKGVGKSVAGSLMRGILGSLISGIGSRR